MDILFWALASFAVFQLSARRRAQLLSLKTPDGFLFLLNFSVTTRQWNKTNLLITSPKWPLKMLRLNCGLIYFLKTANQLRHSATVFPRDGLTGLMVLFALFVSEPSAVPTAASALLFVFNDQIKGGIVVHRSRCLTPTSSILFGVTWFWWYAKCRRRAGTGS